MCWLYVLRSEKDSRLYTGIASDLVRRLREHNQGKVKSTRARRPLVLAYSERFATKSEARTRELYFKTPEGGVLKRKLVERAKTGDTST